MFCAISTASCSSSLIILRLSHRLSPAGVRSVPLSSLSKILKPTSSSNVRIW